MCQCVCKSRHFRIMLYNISTTNEAEFKKLRNTQFDNNSASSHITQNILSSQLFFSSVNQIFSFLHRTVHSRWCACAIITFQTKSFQVFIQTDHAYFAIHQCLDKVFQLLYVCEYLSSQPIKNYPKYYCSKFSTHPDLRHQRARSTSKAKSSAETTKCI